MYNKCTDKNFKSTLSVCLYAAGKIDDLLEGVSYLSLDPAIPAFFHHCAAWGHQLGEQFNVIHDSSKPIAAEKDNLEKMMDQRIAPVTLGYDRRKFEFPLKANGVVFADSKEHVGLQLADMMAGAAAHVASAYSQGRGDEFSKTLTDAGIERFLIGTVWPTLDVTPESLGTDDVGGINAPNYIAKLLK